MSEVLEPEIVEDDQIDERDDSAVNKRIEEADEIIKRYVLWGGGVGLLPIPILDLVFLSAAQTKMLSELTKLYGKSFSEKAASNLITALASGVVTFGLSRYVASMFKAVPGGGALAGVLTQTAAGAALTYAVGRVFVMHYEAGGSLTSFDPKKMRKHFKKIYDGAVNEKPRPKRRVSYAGVKP